MMDDEPDTMPRTVGEVRRRLERMGRPWTVPDHFQDDDPLPEVPGVGRQVATPGPVEGVRAITTPAEFEACLREMPPGNAFLAALRSERGQER